MTATSPTPQQQNRWKGRRCLAAAFIPPPAACSPKTSVALCLYTCFTLSWKTATKQTASSLPPSFCCCFSDKLGPKDRKEEEENSPAKTRAQFTPAAPGSEQEAPCWWTPPTVLRVAHSGETRQRAFCVHVCSLKGRLQIPQWGAATGGGMFRALCSCSGCSAHQWPPGSDKTQVAQFKSNLQYIGTGNCSALPTFWT